MKQQQKRGIMERLREMFTRHTTPPPPQTPLMLTRPPSMLDVGPVTSKEEYEREVKRIAERNARLRRLGYDIDVVTRRTNDGHLQ
jgi:hypothetical protein